MKLGRAVFELSPRSFARFGVSLLGREDPEDLRRFEQVLAALLGRRFGLVLASGKAALALVLEALELPPGSEVLVPAFVAPEVAAVVQARGHRPVPVDIEPETFGMDPQAARELAGPRVRVLVPAHLFGTPCRIADFETLAAERGLVLVEDAAQALGAASGGRPVGSFGLVSTASTGLFKNLNTLSGGAIFTDDEALYRRLRRARDALAPPDRRALLGSWLRWLGLALATRPAAFTLAWPALQLAERLRPGISLRVAHQPDPGFTSGELDLSRYARRLSPGQARLGLDGLARLQRDAEQRRARAELLDRLLGGLEGVATQRVLPGDLSIRLNYPLLLRRRDQRLGALRRASGMDLAPGYMRALSRLRAYGAGRSCPVAERFEDEHLYVPIAAGLPDRDFERAAHRLADALREVHL